jgi:membrane protease YdiL (CAAX protease family)
MNKQRHNLTLVQLDAPRNNKWYEVAILLILLIIRLLDIALTWLFFGSTSPPTWFSALLFFFSYTLTAFLIWLKRDELGNLHIDKVFIYFYIFSGILICLFYQSGIFGLGALLISILIFIALQTNKLDFGEVAPSYLKHRYVILVGLLPFLLVFLINIHFVKSISLDTQTVVAVMLNANFAAVVYEEVLFRAFLWGYLRNLKFSDFQALIIQSVLFWIAHWQKLASGNYFVFLIVLPLLSLLLGFVVLRSRSITQSTISHFLYNALLGLILSSR